MEEDYAIGRSEGMAPVIFPIQKLPNDREAENLRHFASVARVGSLAQAIESSERRLMHAASR